MKRGLALIVVVGILGVLAALAAAFVVMAQLERRASEQRVNAARAYLLARSGIEDALARLGAGQDPDARENRYGGEDWDASGGALNAFEAAQEVFDRGAANVEDCPVRHAMRPSFPAMAGTDPRLLDVQGRKRGYTGRMAGDQAAEGNTYSLHLKDLNSGLCVNAGDGGSDISPAGPNGFLVRLLDNLEAAVTGTDSPTLGADIIGRRHGGGYPSLDALRPVLGAARFARFKPFLTVRAWADPQVVKPQPMEARPHRWEDIDEAHRHGAEASEISGVHHDPTVYTWTSGPSGILLSLNPGISGQGTETLPWRQTITATNRNEGTVTYPVSWERNAIYAWSQLRPAPAAREPRPPVSVNSASREALASVFLGLKGTYLEVWDGAGGWDGGFGWFTYSDWYGPYPNQVPRPTYPYPDRTTEETPWHRTRADYGTSYGHSAFAPPSRPWYGPGNYDPHALPATYRNGFGNTVQGGGGKPLVLSAPLGRLRETLPITREQAVAVADQVRDFIAQMGPLRTWADFNALVDRLPRWEDVDGDGVLDGPFYTVHGQGWTDYDILSHPTQPNGVVVPADYTRHRYQREDGNSDGQMQREVFTPVSGSWAQGNILWQDGGAGIPGLTFVQKDVVKAMANPNTDLNDFNPDANLWKEVDKTDLAGIIDAPAGWAHTTELALESPGFHVIHGLGRVLGKGGGLLASRQASITFSPGRLHRDTTQADFMVAYAAGQPPSSVFSAPAAPYPLSGNQPLVSYPEPQTVAGGGRAADADCDGQLGLGFVATLSTAQETLRADLFDAIKPVQAGIAVEPDLRGPFHERLVRPAGKKTGNVFPDGVYSEKDRTLKFPPPGMSYLGFWVKPHWFPEASPRPHALFSASRAMLPQPYGHNSWALSYNLVPLDDILANPVGLYFVPARNNHNQENGTYDHSPDASKGGRIWPSHALLWGGLHLLYASDNLNRRGMPGTAPTRPVGRLEAHRWQHVSVQTADNVNSGPWLDIGRRPGAGGYALNAGNWYHGGTHLDGRPNHLRFGEVAAEHNMNYAADATFANIQAGNWKTQPFFEGSSGPAARGRHYKEDGATFTSAKLPPGIRSLKVTWTEIPCDLWFDENNDGWLGDPQVVSNIGLSISSWYNNVRVGVNTGPYQPKNDRFTPMPGGLRPLPLPNGKRDVHIEIEIWDDLGTASPLDDVRLARFDDPAADNRVPGPTPLVSIPSLPVPLPSNPPSPQGRLYYKAVFVNEWDADVRTNYPLDVTPFLDDVTIVYETGLGASMLAWDTGDEG